MAELISGMFSATRYKRSQGRIARQLTFAAMAVMIAVGTWKMSSIAGDSFSKYVLPMATLAVGLWASFRVVNVPRFADFLISVEAEMNKVSWPTRAESWRASTVVIIVIFFLAALLFSYDFLLDLILYYAFGL